MSPVVTFNQFGFLAISALLAISPFLRFLCSSVFQLFPQASLRLISLAGLVGRGRLSLTTFLSKSCATEGFRLPPIVLGTLGMFLPEVSLRCWVRMGICRILLSPCGFGLFSDISLPDCRPRGETMLGPLRSTIRHLSMKVRWRGMARGGVKIES